MSHNIFSRNIEWYFLAIHQQLARNFLFQIILLFKYKFNTYLQLVNSYMRSDITHFYLIRSTQALIKTHEKIICCHKNSHSYMKLSLINLGSFEIFQGASYFFRRIHFFIYTSSNSYSFIFRPQSDKSICFSPWKFNKNNKAPFQ